MNFGKIFLMLYLLSGTQFHRTRSYRKPQSITVTFPLHSSLTLVYFHDDSENRTCTSCTPSPADRSTKLTTLTKMLFLSASNKQFAERGQTSARRRSQSYAVVR